MAAQFWTTCKPPSEFSSNGELQVVLAALKGLLVGALGGFAAFLGASIPVGWVLGGLVADGFITQATAVALAGAVAWGLIAAGALYGAVDGMCEALLHGKLACLNGNRCVIGRVMHAERASAFFVDDDKCFNLLLAPHPDGASQAAIEGDGLQGILIARQASTNHLGFTGYPDRTPNGSPVLHCEIEGPGYHNHCIGFKIGAVAIGLAIGICIAVPPACAIALGIALLIALLAWIITSLLTDDPDWEDAAVNPESGSISPANEETGEGGDCVIVTGRWAYDALHDGWNEIHPVLTLQKIPRDQCRADGDVAAFRSQLDSWCKMTGQTRDPLVVEKQKQPDQRWAVDPRLG